MSGEPLQYTHSGRRYLLGYGESFFGIWDRRSEGDEPAHRFPRDDDGWREAWLRFKDLEPESIAVGLASAAGRTEAANARVGPVGDTDGAVSPSRVNPAWWSLPILFGLLGGLIAWGRNRKTHPQVALIMLLLGLATSGLAFYVYLQAIGPYAVR